MNGYNLDNSEITNRVYDTLMKNNQWPQISLDDIEEQHVEARKGIIFFQYTNHEVEIKITSKQI